MKVKDFHIGHTYAAKFNPDVTRYVLPDTLRQVAQGASEPTPANLLANPATPDDLKSQIHLDLYAQENQRFYDKEALRR